MDLDIPDYYTNRWLSLLEFNQRVLEQVKDTSTPVLERLKFLCIFSTNMDEFFEVRVAGVKQRVELGAVSTGPDNLQPTEALRAISRRAHGLVDEQYRVLNDDLIPALAAEHIRFIRRTAWSEHQRDWLQTFFRNELLPVLSPIGLDPAHPFPRILNKSLNFIVSLRGRDAFGRSSGFAVVQAPRSLPRLIALPPDTDGNGTHDFVFLSSIIHAFVEELFPGMSATGCYQFRVTRDGDLFVDEEEVDDLLRAVQGELPSRRYADAVRLEVAHNCPERMWRYLLKEFHLGEADLYRVDGLVNVNRLMALYDLDRPELKYPPFAPRLPAAFNRTGDLFSDIRAQDILLHHPFDSFSPVIDFLRQAAGDPRVLAIKQTLYRTGPDSAVVDALVAAARGGKEVTVVVELRARFDEADNIGLATRLQDAGAHVVYGVVGYKAHAKITLVIRREDNSLRHYVHLGTGNYHPRTARLYTDYGLFTCDPAIGRDAHRVFMQLTGLGRVARLEKLLQSPFTLHPAMLEKIERETAHAEAGRPSRIIIKMNALVDPELIKALYRASAAGVEIDLIVRGMCCLRPGIPGISERIRVRSVIGRFLEHSRVFCFQNHDQPELYCASADWMERNFFRRVEVCFPVDAAHARERIMRDLEIYLQDNIQTWLQQPDGSYERAQVGDAEPFSAQRRLMETDAVNPVDR